MASEIISNKDMTQLEMIKILDSIHKVKADKKTQR